MPVLSSDIPHLLSVSACLAYLAVYSDKHTCRRCGCPCLETSRVEIYSACSGAYQKDDVSEHMSCSLSDAETSPHMCPHACLSSWCAVSSRPGCNLANGPFMGGCVFYYPVLLSWVHCLASLIETAYPASQTCMCLTHSVTHAVWHSVTHAVWHSVTHTVWHSVMFCHSPC